MILAEPLQITCIVTQTLESLGIRYFVGGSLASSFHGIPRATQDDLDYAYLERVAEQRNVLPLLKQAIAEILENAV